MQVECLSAMIDAERSDLASMAVETFGPAAVLTVLDRASTTENSDLGQWFLAAAAHTTGVGEYLSVGHSISKKTLYFLAQRLSPDAIQNDYGADPWIIAWQHSYGSLSEGQHRYLSSYFLCRALGYRSRSQGELAHIGFDTTYIAAANGELPDEAWRMLEPRLPNSMFWYDWDRCQNSALASSTCSWIAISLPTGLVG